MIEEIVSGDEEAGARIMRAASGAVFDPRAETCIARYVNGELYGGVVFGNYTGRSCEIHCAGLRPRWVSRKLLFLTFDYPFRQMNLEKLFARVQASNTAALRFDMNIGFTVEATLKDVYPDGDMVVLSMYKRDCRHLDIRPKGLRNG